MAEIPEASHTFDESDEVNREEILDFIKSEELSKLSESMTEISDEHFGKPDEFPTSLAENNSFPSSSANDDDLGVTYPSSGEKLEKDLENEEIDSNIARELLSPQTFMDDKEIVSEELPKDSSKTTVVDEESTRINSTDIHLVHTNNAFNQEINNMLVKEMLTNVESKSENLSDISADTGKTPPSSIDAKVTKHTVHTESKVMDSQKNVSSKNLGNESTSEIIQDITISSRYTQSTEKFSYVSNQKSVLENFTGENVLEKFNQENVLENFNLEDVSKKFNQENVLENFIRDQSPKIYDDDQHRIDSDKRIPPNSSLSTELSESPGHISSDSSNNPNQLFDNLTNVATIFQAAMPASYVSSLKTKVAEVVQRAANVSNSDVEDISDTSSEENFPSPAVSPQPVSGVKFNVSKTSDPTRHEQILVTDLQCYHEVVNLIYWRDVKKSGIVFGTLLVLLLSLMYFSFISVAAYTSLLLLSGTFSFRVYLIGKKAIQKTEEVDPLKKYMEVDTNLKGEKMHEMTDVFVSHFNCITNELKRLFLVQDFFDSLKFGCLLWVLTYVGSWFNGLTLVFLAVISMFSLPKVYEQNQAQFDQYIGLVSTHVNEVIAKVRAMIPIGNKEKAQ